MPTAFKASFKCGSGKPVIGLLAEYDALSGLSQKAASPRQEAIEPGGAGHGCGHNLIGAGCYAAAVALKEYFTAHSIDGYRWPFSAAPPRRAPAPSSSSPGPATLTTWTSPIPGHPATVNEVGSKGSVAIMGANFIFDGVAAHAGGAPHLGRSALDAVELMNVGANYLREHMIDAARIHYAYSDPGGTAPNVVQSHAVIKYEVRAPKVNQVQELFTRLVDVAKGAALDDRHQDAVRDNHGLLRLRAQPHPGRADGREHARSWGPRSGRRRNTPWPGTSCAPTAASDHAGA